MTRLKAGHFAQFDNQIIAIQSEANRLLCGDWLPDAARQLHWLAHKLSDSAGIFGAIDLGKAACRLEQLLVAHLEIPPVHGEVPQQIARSIMEIAGLALDAGYAGPAAVQDGREQAKNLVYIVDDDIDFAAMLAEQLAAVGYQTQVFRQIGHFKTACEQSPLPCAVVMGVVFPDSRDVGVRAVAELKRQCGEKVPVIFISVRDDVEARLAALRAGAARYFAKPFGLERLVAALDDLTGARLDEPYRVLLVGDNELLLAYFAVALQNAGMSVCAVSEPLQALRQARAYNPDVAVLDVDMPQMGGLELAMLLREDDASSQIPILFLPGETDLHQQLLALDFGGGEFLTEPIDPALFQVTVRARAKRSRRARAVSDDLRRVLREKEFQQYTLDQHAIASVADPAGNITYVNDKFCAVSGYSAAELIGQNHRILKSGMHPDAFYREMWDTIAAGKVWQGKVCNRKKNGEHYWVESTIVPFLDEAGLPCQYVSVRTEITALMELETRVRSERDFSDAVIDILPGTFYVISEEGKFLRFNNNLASLTGYTIAEVWRMSPLDFFEAGDRATVAARIEEVFAQGSATLDAPLLTKAGEHILFYFQAVRAELLGQRCLIGTGTDISALRAAQEAERQANDRLSFLVKSSPAVLYSLVYREGEFTTAWVSENIERLLGYTAAEALAPGWWLEHVHHDDRRRALAGWADLLEKGEISYEYRFQLKDGDYLYVLDQLKIIRKLAQGFELIGGWTDITELRKTQDQLKLNEERLRRSQAYANIGTWDWDVQNGNLFWSERIGPLFGYTDLVETTYENFLKAVHPDDRQNVLAAIGACVERGVKYNVEHRVVWPDGTVRWMQERGDVVRAAGGKPLHMLGVVMDITERKLAEDALRESRARLEEAQRLAKIGNWEVDLVGGGLHWADEVYRIFGRDPASFTPSYENFFSAVHPEDRELVKASERRAQQTGVHSVVHRILLPDGEVRYVRELASVTYGEDSSATGLVGTVQDVTELKQTEQALIVARDEAETANRAKSEFLARMSHELRTPMNAILGFSQLLETDPSLNGDQHDNLHEILKAGRHLLELINEVLDLAKIDAGRIDLSIESVPFGELAEECLSLMRPLAEKRGIAFEQRNIDVVLRADRVRLKQVLINLLSNAIKYNRPAGRVVLDVAANDDGWLRVLVSDTGPGIPSERLGELFQAFSRLDAEAQEIEGTGIGLVISRRLIEAMGGTIGADSTVGQGSAFWFTLPPGETANSPAAHLGRQSEVAASPARPAGKSHTVLYIEDNPSNLQLVNRIFARMPELHLFTAHAPGLGLELAKQHRPDLILLDINMPGMDGYQVLAQLQAEEWGRGIPVIAITANAMPRDIERGEAAGFAAYLTKPLDVQRFLAVIEMLLK